MPHIINQRSTSTPVARQFLTIAKSPSSIAGPSFEKILSYAARNNIEEVRKTIEANKLNTCVRTVAKFDSEWNFGRGLFSSK
jgi:hypothetical protein